MKLVSEQNDEIPLKNMKWGQIAVITKWPCATDTEGKRYNTEGKIVQRYNADLVFLREDNSMLNVFNMKDEGEMVRILHKGTRLEIE